MNDSEKDRDPLEMLAAEFVERQRKGVDVTVEQYAEDYPDMAEEIRELFPTIAAMEKFKVQKERFSSGRASLGPIRIERLGDFRIVREIGRGGMGVVFEAEQESLARRVAIKVLPRHALIDEEHLKRFDRETRIAANLHHTNIVPVFGAGEHDRFHYFVMQCIDGVGLDKVIERLIRTFHRSDDQAIKVSPESDNLSKPDKKANIGQAQVTGIIQNVFNLSVNEKTRPEGADPADRTPKNHPMGSAYWKRVAEIGLQAARALDYAHTLGTLHRDIKPANLLIDAQGVVWVSDFGVAKILDSEEVTRTGDISGTLRYMAPERFTGQEDARSDQYSLGLTMYELLCMQPAYDDTNRTRLLHRITQEAPEPPRRLNPKIPRDLETIVLTTLARNPNHRYASSGALANDLERFINDLPVRARRISSIERLWRWCRRNPLVAGLGAAVLVLLFVVAVVSGMGYMETKAANFQVTKALEGEKAQREKAQATSELALEVLDKIYTQLAPLQKVVGSGYGYQGSEGDWVYLPTQPALSKQNAVMLENLLVFYDRFAEQLGEDPALIRKSAQANQRVGAIRLLLGQYDASRIAYQRALGRYDGIRGAFENEPNFVVEIASVYNELGTAERYAGQSQMAFEAYQEALNLLDTSGSYLGDNDSGGTGSGMNEPGEDLSPEHRYELARTCYFLGTKNWNRPGEDSPSFGGMPPSGDRNRPPHHRGRRGPPGGGPEKDHAGQRPPADGSTEKRPPGRGMDDGPPSRHDANMDTVARDHLDKAVRLLKTLHEEQPKIPGFRHLLACCYRDEPPGVRPMHENMERWGEAAGIFEALVEEFPRNTEYVHGLCETYARLNIRDPLIPGETYHTLEERLLKGLQLSEELVAAHPEVPSYAVTEVHILLKLSELLQRMDWGAQAEVHLRKALEVQTSLAERFPQAAYKVWLAEVQRALAGTLAGKYRMEDARTLLESALETLEIVWETEERPEKFQVLMGGCCHELGRILMEMGEMEAAEKIFQKERRYRETQR